MTTKMYKKELKEETNQKDAISQNIRHNNNQQYYYEDNNDTGTNNDEKLTFRERRQLQLQQLHTDESNNTDFLTVQQEHEALPGAYQSGNLDGVTMLDGSIVVGDPMKDERYYTENDLQFHQQKYRAREERPDILAGLAGATITEAVLVEDDENKDEKLDEERRREEIRQEIMQQAATAHVVSNNNVPTDSNGDTNNKDNAISKCNVWYFLGACLCCECWLRCFEMCLEAMES
jgi:hypothetical protein